MATLNLLITPSRVDAHSNLYISGKPHETAKSLANYFQALAARHESATVEVQTNSSSPVAASGTITVASVQADDTFTLGGITFTGKASPSGDIQFDSDGSDSVVAAAIAAKINAHPTLSKIVSASAADEVVTVTCLVKGVIGNFITLSSSGATLTVSAAALASGTGGPTDAATSFSF